MSCQAVSRRNVRYAFPLVRVNTPKDPAVGLQGYLAYTKQHHPKTLQ